MKYFEDIQVGDVFEVGRYTFTADEIKAFAARFDPQPFHRRRGGGGALAFRRAVSPPAGIPRLAWMRLMVDHRRRMDEAMRARGEPVAGIGPALGFRELKWLKPVYVGDTIEYKSEVTEMRVSDSRPRLGLMTFRSTGVNQNGEPVISLVSTTFVERRGEAP